MPSFQEAAEELRGILDSPEMPRGVPVLILANKQDLPQASRPSEIADKLFLNSYRFLLNYLSR
jgi:ADP-ribosylation factor protein 1